MITWPQRFATVLIEAGRGWGIFSRFLTPPWELGHCFGPRGGEFTRFCKTSNTKNNRIATHWEPIRKEASKSSYPAAGVLTGAWRTLDSINGDNVKTRWGSPKSGQFSVLTQISNGEQGSSQGKPGYSRRNRWHTHSWNLNFIESENWTGLITIVLIEKQIIAWSNFYHAKWSYEIWYISPYYVCETLRCTACQCNEPPWYGNSTYRLRGIIRKQKYRIRLTLLTPGLPGYDMHNWDHT